MLHSSGGGGRRGLRGHVHLQPSAAKLVDMLTDNNIIKCVPDYELTEVVITCTLHGEADLQLFVRHRLQAYDRFGLVEPVY